MLCQEESRTFQILFIHGIFCHLLVSYPLLCSFWKLWRIYQKPRHCNTWSGSGTGWQQRKESYKEKERCSGSYRQTEWFLVVRMTQLLRDQASDSEEVVRPLMLDGTYLTALHSRSPQHHRGSQVCLSFTSFFVMLELFGAPTAPKNYVRHAQSYFKVRCIRSIPLSYYYHLLSLLLLLLLLLIL